MPETEVVLFAEEDGSCPLLEWMDTLSPKARDKCIVKIERPREIDLAVERKKKFESEPLKHTFRG